jgi:hypothetical protein
MKSLQSNAVSTARSCDAIANNKCGERETLSSPRINQMDQANGGMAL